MKEKTKNILSVPFEKLKWAIYGLGVKAHKTFHRKKNKDKVHFSSRKTKETFFYILIMAIPVVHFCIFYVGVNANSLALAFKTYERGENAAYHWVGFANFATVLNDLFHNPSMLRALGNSAYSYILSTAISLPLAVLFGYYTFKKYWGHSVFRVGLFIPSIISSVVVVTIFLNCAETAIPAVINAVFGKEIPGLIGNPDTAFGTILFYGIWIGFGSSVLIYLGSMSSIDTSVLEAGWLDGATGFREFIHIVLPLVYPTVSTMFMLGVSGVLMGTLDLYTFYGDLAADKIRVINYILFSMTKNATVADYPYISAMGILFTCVGLPLTLIVKYLLEKFGPSTE